MNLERFIVENVRGIRASEIRETLKIIKEKKDVISFAGGMPDPRFFPKKELAEISKLVIEKYGKECLQYSETKGVKEVRKAIQILAKKRGIEAELENIIITEGSQQAISMVSTALLKKSDIVITESPTYLAALGSFRICGARIIGIEMDENGMRVDKLEEFLRKNKEIKFVYTIPIAQNPTGLSMSKDRKKYLLELASKFDFLIVEDDPYGYFVFENVNNEPIKMLDKEGRVIYLSTISKILAPGLRIGWMILPEELSRKFELFKQYIDLHTTTLTQYLVAEAIKNGLVEKQIKLLKKVYKKKRDAMLSCLENFPKWVEFTKPVGGFFIFLKINKKFDGRKSLSLAINKYKVAYIPGQSFYPNNKGKNTIRLSYSMPPVNLIEKGMDRLKHFLVRVCG